MRDLKFKYIKAENFICFGPEGIEIDFEKFGNIILIKGQNLDVSDEDGKIASNGSGKSSIPDCITYALYGSTVKKPKKLGHANIINNKHPKKLRVELHWDNFKVIRTRKPDRLELWEKIGKEWKDISVGGIPTTQQEIDKKIGLSYEAFVNVFIFSDDNTMSFLECDSPTKREIVENLLSLDKYRIYSENAKTHLKTIKDKIKYLSHEYDSLSNEVETCRTHISQIENQEKEWALSKEKEILVLLNKIKQKNDELEQTDEGINLKKYTEAQEQIKELKDVIPGKEAEIDKLNGILETAKERLENTEQEIESQQPKHKEVQNKLEEYERIIERNENIVFDWTSKKGRNCPYCLGTVDEKNFKDILNNAKEVIDSTRPAMDALIPIFKRMSEELNESLKTKTVLENGISGVNTKLKKHNNELTEIHTSISECSKVKKPESGLNELLIQEQISELKKQALAKKKDSSPFDAIKKTANDEYLNKIKEYKDKKAEIKCVEEELPYYEFWVRAFGDTGIRKFVIDGIIPALNARIAYWLQFLIDNKIKLTFDNELKETIDRYPFNGRPFVYHGMSGGQRRRLNLTVSQAFAYVEMLNTGTSPSLVFLDEVTMNMDEIGVQGIYRMICELAKEKQVFVIDHNENLLQMLEGYDTIKVKLKDEISKIAN